MFNQSKKQDTTSNYQTEVDSQIFELGDEDMTNNNRSITHNQLGKSWKEHFQNVISKYTKIK